MYYYILDQNNIPVDQFERMQTELQGLLAEFKIAGETARVTPLRTIADLVDTASQRGATTLIACGSDDTFNQMLAALKGRDFTLGFIPFTETSYLAHVMGIGNLRLGVKTIAARRLEKIDLARITGNYFLSYLEFGIMSRNVGNAGFFSGFKLLSSAPVRLVVRIDDSYNLEQICLGGLLVNTRATSSHSESIANPTDSFLDLLVMEPLNKTEILRYRGDIAKGLLERIPKTTVIKCRKVEFLEPAGFPLTMAGRIVAKAPSTVEIIPQRLKMIVGKNRTF